MLNDVNRFFELGNTVTGDIAMNGTSVVGGLVLFNNSMSHEMKGLLSAHVD